MDKSVIGGVSPYHEFSRQAWAHLRADQPLTLTADDLYRLQSINDPVSIEEVVAIYLPLSRLMSLYVEAAQKLYEATRTFLGSGTRKVPYVIGIAGSVSVGKSTTARILQALLARWPNMPKVDLVTTDGFLLPNAVLEAEGLMQKKGFPESYDLPALLSFLSAIKAGVPAVRAPVYSHFYYDVLPDQTLVVDRPDILIVEGLTVLQSRNLKDGRAVPFVSDFFDFSIYIDAEEELLEKWYVDRFERLRATAFRDPNSYFHKYAGLSDEQALETALSIWRRINLMNLRDNIRPTRARADLILTKGASHMIDSVRLRKI